jgi:hypothetical protein
MKSLSFLEKKFLYSYILISMVCFICVACAQKGSSIKATPELKIPTDSRQVDEATAKRLASELETLKKSGKASPELVKDYEEYLKQIQAINGEKKRAAREVEAAYARHQSQKKSANTEGPKHMDPMWKSDPKLGQTEDEVVALEKELNSSMAEFDEMLLKELETIREESDNRMRDLAQEADTAAQRLRERGFDLDSRHSGLSGSRNERDDGFKRDPEQTKGTDTTMSGQKGKRRGTETDDDIVARQLREAAENETDPKLKEKLWEEYEAYKKNTRAQ